MNRVVLCIRKLMAWGNPMDLENLNENGKRMGFWESLGW